MEEVGGGWQRGGEVWVGGKDAGEPADLEDGNEHGLR